MDAIHPHAHSLIRKMESIITLSDEERAALMRLPMQVQDLRADQDIVREGDRVSRSCLLIEGFACRYKTTAEGKRQILSFHIPGEIPDLQSLHLKTMDHSLQTITRAKVGFITHSDLTDLCARQPRLAGVLWRETLIDASIFREWMINIGCREAYARACHLLCELRAALAGLSGDERCLPDCGSGGPPFEPGRLYHFCQRLGLWRRKFAFPVLCAEENERAGSTCGCEAPVSSASPLF